MRPFFSVCILNYNYGRFLAAAIESVLAQDFQDYELIIVDDGSTDNSRAIIQEYGGRVKPVFKENGGLASSYNAGFAHSTGEVICYLDADDVFLPHKLSTLAQIYRENHEIGWVYHLMRRETLQGKQVDSLPRNPPGVADLRQKMTLGALVPMGGAATGGMSFRHTLLAQFLPMPEVKNSAFDDNYLKFSSYTLTKGYYLNEILSVQRIHGNNAYTLNPRNKIDQAKRTILAAYWLRKRFPIIQLFTDRLMAKGLAYQRQSGWTEAQYEQIIQEYLASTPLYRRLLISGLAWLYFFISRRQM